MNIRQNKNKKLKEAILKTIAFFDIFDYPLTGYELHRFLPYECNLEEVEEALKNINELDNKQGFYFFKNNEELVDIRQKRYAGFLSKLKIARRVTWVYSWIPWVKMIAVANIIGPANTKVRGDIDFFIITEKNRIWLTRLFCSGFAKLLKIRPEPGNKTNKICLSYYVAEDQLDIGDFSYQFNQMNKEYDKEKYFDIYYLYWLINLFVMYDKGGTYKKFIAHNSWIKNYTPNWQPMITKHSYMVARNCSQLYKDIWEMLFSGLEAWVHRWQLNIMPVEFVKKIGTGTSVVINKKIIKMFMNDKRGEVLRLWLKKVERLRIGN